MSKKSFFSRGKKADEPAAPERTAQQIKDEYSSVCGLAGEVQFKMKASEAQLNQLNQRLVQLHNEYNAADIKEKMAKDKINQSAVEPTAKQES